MEANGEPGRVLISENSKNMLSTNFPDMYEYKYHKMVELPNFKKSI